MARMMEHERWDRVFNATYVGVPWQLRLDQRNLVRPVVPEAEAEQGVAPVIVMPAVPKIDRRRYVIMTGAEIALANSWQVMTIRDRLSE